MLETLGGFIGGLGLFFVGMWLLTENLKALSTRRLRRIVANWIPNRYAAWCWGVLSGSVLQSMPAQTFITISMFRANLITTERAFAFILGGNIGAGVLVPLVSLDIKLAALYVLGAASVLMVSQKAIKLRNIGAALFGAALMFVGLSLVKESAMSLTGQPIFDEFLGLADRSLWSYFLAAAVLSFIVQSSVAVMVFAVGMASVGVLTDDQAIMSIYGSFLGTNATLLMLSFNLTGVSRRIAMVQVLYNLLTISVFVPLLYVELWSGAPLIKSLILSVPLDHPLAALSLLTDLFLAVPVIIFLLPIVRFFSFLWPSTTAEIVSRAAYIHARSYGDVTTALELITLEQRRVLSAFSSYLDAVRHGSGIDSLRDSVRSLIWEIDEFLTETRVRNPGHEIEFVSSMLARQRLIVWLEEQFAELCAELNELPNEGSAGQLRDVMVDGIDAVVLVIIDGLTSRDQEDWQTAVQLTGDRSELLRRIRGDYTSGDIPLSDTVQASILKVTSTAGEIFFLFSRLTHEMENSSVLLPTSQNSPSPEVMDN